MRLPCAILLLLVVVFDGGQCAKITQKPIDFGEDVFGSLKKDVPTMKIPELKDNADTPLGTITYQLTNIRMKSFDYGGTSAKVQSNVEIHASGVSASLSGHWRYRKVHWPHIEDSGSVDVSISGMSLGVTVGLGKDSNGHTSISVDKCSGNIANVKVKFHGGASWLYNLFKSHIENGMKDLLKDEICKAVPKAIKEVVKKL